MVYLINLLVFLYLLWAYLTSVFFTFDSLNVEFAIALIRYSNIRREIFVNETGVFYQAILPLAQSFVTTIGISQITF